MCIKKGAIDFADRITFKSDCDDVKTSRASQKCMHLICYLVRFHWVISSNLGTARKRLTPCRERERDREKNSSVEIRKYNGQLSGITRGLSEPKLHNDICFLRSILISMRVFCISISAAMCYCWFLAWCVLMPANRYC